MPPGFVVVVGAGQAGGRAIEALRTQGYAGRISLIGAEPHLPYERPSLSKEMLLDLTQERIDWVRPAAWYDDHAIDRHLGSTVVAIDRAARQVVLGDGRTIDYGALILATGTLPRTLPDLDHPRVLTLRSIEDSRALRPHLLAAARVVVVGGGFIGLEVAAAARSHGCAVTVLEAADRVMARGVPRRISDIYARLHRNHGVDLRLNADAAMIRDTTREADIVVVGIGVVPNDGLAAACGLAVADGIVVDAQGRTDDKAIYAAGDVTRHFNPLLGRSVRLESWQNAQNQAITVARAIMGEAVAYAEVPWFWSDQHGIAMQIAGLTDPDAITVERGSLDEHAGVLFELVDGRMVCAVGLNATRDLRMAKQIMTLGQTVDPAALADPAVKLNDLYRSLKALAAG